MWKYILPIYFTYTRQILSFDNMKEEDELVRLTNEYRAQKNKGPLTRNPVLDKAAEFQAEYCKKIGDLTHENEGKYEKLGDRLTEFGYKYTNAGENAAQTNSKYAQEPLDLWKHSPGHNANLLKDEFNEVGIASVLGDDDRMWWIAVYARGRNAGPTKPENEKNEAPIDIKAGIPFDIKTSVPVDVNGMIPVDVTVENPIMLDKNKKPEIKDDKLPRLNGDKIVKKLCDEYLDGVLPNNIENKDPENDTKPEKEELANIDKPSIEDLPSNLQPTKNVMPHPSAPEKVPEIISTPSFGVTPPTLPLSVPEKPMIHSIENVPGIMPVNPDCPPPIVSPEKNFSPLSPPPPSLETIKQLEKKAAEQKNICDRIINFVASNLKKLINDTIPIRDESGYKKPNSLNSDFSNIVTYQRYKKNFAALNKKLKRLKRKSFLDRERYEESD